MLQSETVQLQNQFNNSRKNEQVTIILFRSLKNNSWAQQKYQHCKHPWWVETRRNERKNRSLFQKVYLNWRKWLDSYPSWRLHWVKIRRERN